MVARSERHPELVAGVEQKVYRWLCPSCSEVSCAHEKWAPSGDPDFGKAMAWLVCGHRAVANRRVMERSGVDTVRCVCCVPWHWIVHIREVDRNRLAERRKRAMVKV